MNHALAQSKSWDMKYVRNMSNTEFCLSHRQHLRASNEWSCRGGRSALVSSLSLSMSSSLAPFSVRQCMTIDRERNKIYCTDETISGNSASAGTLIPVISTNNVT